MNVLIADDEPMTRAVLARILTNELKATVVEAENGLEALRQLSSQDIDLVLLDVSMPVMDGARTLTAIRSSPKHEDVPVIMLTAADDATLVKQLLGLGIADYIRKPSPPDVIHARLAKVFQRLAPAGSVPGWLDHTATVVVADADAELRAALVVALGADPRVVEVASGTAALLTCLQVAPSVIFVGPSLGVLRPEQLIARLRDNRQTARMTIVRVARDGSGPDDAAGADHVLVDGLQPDSLRRQLAALAVSSPAEPVAQ